MGKLGGRNMEDYKIRKTRVKAIMADNNVTVKDLARQLEVTPNMIYRKLNGISQWTLQDLIILKTISGKSFDYVFGLSDK